MVLSINGTFSRYQPTWPLGSLEIQWKTLYGVLYVRHRRVWCLNDPNYIRNSVSSLETTESEPLVENRRLSILSTFL